MQVKAKLRYLRIAPRKVRLAADLIRRKKAQEAQAILAFTQKRAARPLLKLLRSAIANAVNNFQLKESNLYISKIVVDQGPILKRWRARARGRAYEIQKKTSHISLVLDEIEKPKAKRTTKAKKQKKETKGLKETEATMTKGALAQEKEKETKPLAEKPRPKFQPEVKRPKIKTGIKRIFRRKAF